MPERLVIAAEVEPSGIRRGMEQGVRDAARAVQQLQQEASKFRLDASAIIPPNLAAQASRAGAEAGKAIVARVRESVAELRNLAINLDTVSNKTSPADIGAFRQLVAEQKALADATAGATVEQGRLARAIKAIDAGNLTEAHRSLAGFHEEARRGSNTTFAALAQERAALESVIASTRQAEAAARSSAAATAQEAQARKEAAATLRSGMSELRLYARTVDGTNASAVAAWRQQAAALRAQAQSTGASRLEMLRLDAVIRQTEASFKRQGDAAAAAGRQGSISSALVMRAALSAGSALTAAFSVRQVLAFADAQTLINARLQLVARSSEELAQIQGDIFASSQRTLTGYGDSAALFSRIAIASRELGRSKSEVLEFVEAVQLAGRIGGSSTQEMASGVRQLAQAFGRGELRGQDLLSVLSMMPGVADAIARGWENADGSIGVATAALHEMGANGELDINKVMDALLRLLPELEKTAGTMEHTLGQSVTMLTNSLGIFIGQINAATGATGGLGSGIERVANKISNFIPLLKIEAEYYREFIKIQNSIGTDKPLSMAGADAALERIAKARQRFAQGASVLEVLPDFSDVAAGATSSATAIKALTAAQAEYIKGLKDRAAATDADSAALATYIARQRETLAKLEENPTQGNSRQRLELRKEIEELTKPRKVKVEVDLESRAAQKALDEFLSPAADALRRLELGRELGATTEQMAVLLGNVTAEQERLNARMKAEGDILGVNLRTAEQYAKLRAATDISDPVLKLPGRAPEFLKMPDARVQLDPWLKGFAELRRMADAVAQATAGLELARATGDTEQIADAEARLKDVTAAAIRTRAAVAGLAAGLEGPALTAFVKGWTEASEGISVAAEETDKLTARLRLVATGVRGVLQLAGAFDAVGDTVKGVADGVLGMISGIAEARDALESINKAREKTGGKADAGVGDLFGSVAGMTSLVGVIGGAVGIISSLANRGPSRLEVLMGKNNESLERLRDSLNSTRASLGTLTRIQEAARTLPRADIRDVGTGAANWAWSTINLEKLNAELAKSGLTFADINKIAKEYGIQLQDASGKTRPEAFEQLAEAMDLARRAALKWADDFASLRDQQAFRDDINDVASSPARDLANAQEIFRRMTEQVPELYDRLFAGIDTASAAGRAQLNDRLNEIIESAMAGTIRGRDGKTFSDMLLESGFANIEEWKESILSVDHALDAFTESLMNAARSDQQLRNAVFNVEDTPQQGLTDVASIWQQFLPDLYQQVFGSATAGTDDARAIIRNGIQSLTNEFLSPDFKEGKGRLADALRTAGVSTEAFREMLITGDAALDRFAEAAADAAEIIKDTFASLTKMQSFLDQVFDREDTPQLALSNAATIFAQLAPALYDRIFAGADQGSAQGRAVINDRLNALATEMISHEFKIGQGWLADVLRNSGLSADDLMSSILGADGALDDFTTNTNEAAEAAKLAAEAMINLPAGFRKGGLEWMASAEGLLDNIRLQVPIARYEPAAPTGYMTASPTGASGRGGSVVVHQDNSQDVSLVLHAAPGMNTDDIAREFNTRIRNKARANGGDVAAALAFQIPTGN